MNQNTSWVLALTPLGIEQKYLLETLKKKTGWTEKSFGTLRVTFFKDLHLAVSVGGHGKTQYALQAQYLIHELKNVRGLICVGAAGALSKELNLGDVIVASKTIEHDFRTGFMKQKEPEFLGYEPWLLSLQTFQDPGFQLHTLMIASGDEDILRVDRVNEIIQQTSAQAVAWEGAGNGRVG